MNANAHAPPRCTVNNANGPGIINIGSNVIDIGNSPGGGHRDRVKDTLNRNVLFASTTGTH